MNDMEHALISVECAYTIAQLPMSLQSHHAETAQGQA